MKLILCTACYDVFKLSQKEQRQCVCGLCTGFYHENGINAEYRGDSAIPIGFANSSLMQAIKNQPQDGRGEKFTAFVIPKSCLTMTQMEPTFKDGDKVVCIAKANIESTMTIGRAYKVVADSYMILGNEYVPIVETDGQEAYHCETCNFDLVSRGELL